ncbi:hypothetical protein [Dactylosporangium sp. NPDC048998]|uniref:hypothetical protein n=1 Tax=Dactylosporangium sp. NPDC048998 TaxID=3363976 RepID=UPI0037217AC5
MIRVVRWVLLGFCLISLLSLLSTRGGLGEYARGASLTTAHLGTCFEDIDQLERPRITCSARWNAGADEVRGTVSEVDPTGARAVIEGTSGVHYEVRLPATATDVRVFADGTKARPADTRSVALGAGFLIAVVGLLAWEAVVLLRRCAARRCVARPAKLEPA